MCGGGAFVKQFKENHDLKLQFLVGSVELPNNIFLCRHGSMILEREEEGLGKGGGEGEVMSININTWNRGCSV